MRGQQLAYQATLGGAGEVDRAQGGRGRHRWPLAASRPIGCAELGLLPLLACAFSRATRACASSPGRAAYHDTSEACASAEAVTDSLGDFDFVLVTDASCACQVTLPGNAVR